MDTKSKILFLFIAFSIVLSVGTLYYKSIVVQDFDLITIEDESNQEEAEE